MAVLLNATSNLRLRLELVRRVSDGVRAPASLEARCVVERYAHAGHGFVPVLELPSLTVLDLDLMGFLDQLEELLAGRGESAAFEASVDAALGLRVAREGPEALVVEAGIDLLGLLEPIGGLRGDRGSDLILLRFGATQRGALAFCAGMIDELARFPTDPSQVHPGDPG